MKDIIQIAKPAGVYAKGHSCLQLLKASAHDSQSKYCFLPTSLLKGNILSYVLEHNKISFKSNLL